MFHVVPLLATLALVSMQSGCLVGAQVNNELENNLQANDVRATPRIRGQRARSFIIISVPPPESAQVSAGATLELICEIMGGPDPQIHWLKNGEPIEEYDQGSNEITPVEPSSLVSMISTLIITATTPNTEDIYTCVATAGTKKKSAFTTVYTTSGADEPELMTLKKLMRLPSRPRIVTHYTDLFQNSGTNVVLPCKVYSRQPAKIYWQDRNGDIVYHGNPRMRVLPSGELLITSLRWADMGDYTCTVKNEMGKDSITTFIYPLSVKED